MNENAPKISVIVPMYNVEKYLNLCISSILAQTFKDFELILIDDCSTDKTLEVAKSFSDSRIKILQNEKNLGTPGATRNIAIDAAQGEYIYFCDSDDALLKNALELLYNAAKNNNADVSTTTKSYYAANSEFSSLKNLKANIKESPLPLAPVSENIKTRIYQELLKNGVHIAVWYFLYRRKFLLENNIKFPDEVAEDVFFNFDVICATSKIIKIDTPFYIYRTRQGSVTHDIKRIQKNVKSIPVLCEHIEEKLLPLNDKKFTRMVLNYWISDVIRGYILPYIKGGAEIEEEILKALEPLFGKNSSFVLTILQLYCQERFVMRENKILKEKLENVKKIIEA